MPLYDVTWGTGTPIDPKKAEHAEALEALRKKCHAKTFDKMIRTVDNALEGLKPSKSSGLTWTKTGAILGNDSSEPLEAINHLWQKTDEVLGGRPTLFAIGQLVKWRVSLREEIWLMFRQESKKRDDLTHELIKVATYWIDDDFITPKRNTLEDLTTRFNIH